MNICIVSTYSCTFDQFKELVDESMEEAKAFMSEYELVRVNEHKSIMLVNVRDMEKMQAFMTTPEMQEWDKANNCVDHVYSMKRVK
jgi:quinol monooxygenase YgiN